MKLPRSSGKPKKRKLLVVRRVHGRSMMPYLNPGQIVIGHGFYKEIKPRDIVIIEHNNTEKIKRVVEIKDETVFVVGDNVIESTDSRKFGALPITCIRAKVIS